MTTPVAPGRQVHTEINGQRRFQRFWQPVHGGRGAFGEQSLDVIAQRRSVSALPEKCERQRAGLSWRRLAKRRDVGTHDELPLSGFFVLLFLKLPPKVRFGFVKRPVASFEGCPPLRDHNVVAGIL